MSTNFYWNPSPASPLAPFGQLHIGKRSGGWSFSFQGIVFEGRPAEERALEVADSLSVMVQVPALPPVCLKSYADWKQLLSEPGSTIEDEYRSSVTPEEFFEMVEGYLHPTKGTWGTDARAQPLLNHFDELAKQPHRYGPIDPQRDWKDAEGYSFTASNFS